MVGELTSGGLLDIYPLGFEMIDLGSMTYLDHGQVLEVRHMYSYLIHPSI